MPSNQTTSALSLFATVACTLAIGTIGCSGVKEISGNSIGPQEFSDLETKSGMTFPNGSKASAIAYDHRSIDPALYAKVKIPTAKRAEVLNYLNSAPQRSGHIIGDIPVKWWPAGSVAPVAECEMVRGGEVCVISCYDEDDGLFLYIQWFHI